MNEMVKQYIEAGKHYLEEDTLDKFFSIHQKQKLYFTS